MFSSLLDYYKAIEGASARMLAAAKKDDWDEVVRLEGACAVLIAQLRERSKWLELASEERADKRRVMMTILRHDAQIRGLVEPRLDDVSHALYSRDPKIQLH